MEPRDSTEEAEFRAAARAFLDANADPVEATTVSPSAIVAEWKPEEEEQRLAAARAWQRLKYEAGWAGISWPAAYGGRGGTLMQQLIFGQEESEFDVPHDALAIGLNWCGPAVMQHGDEEQRLRWLPALLRGDEMWCQLFSEPGAGSDLAGLGTRATRDGDEWVITGQKVWTTFAHRSDWGLCIARHDPDQPKHRGMTAFAVDIRAAGVTCRPVLQMTESRNFNEVFLDEVTVPDAHRIGDVGDGWRVVITTFMWERLSLAFSGGRVVAALQRLAQERGRASDPTVRQRFAQIYTRAAALRFTGLRLLTAVSQGQMPGPEGSIMKLSLTSVLTDLYELAVDLFDAGGMLGTDAAPWAGEWHAGFLGMPGLRIGGGTDLVQRNIIGERVLGLPGDIRVDIDVPWSKIPGLTVRIHVVTVFPEYFASPLGVSLVAKAQGEGILKVVIHDLRDHGKGVHRQVDDAPYGGGAGMVMMVEPLAGALAPLGETHRVLFTPAGTPLDQAILDRWASLDELTLVCGRYEGVDERVAENLVDEEVSLGDYVLLGGEVAALAVIEGVARLLPGVVGNPASVETESFRDGQLEEPQYTRPSEFRGWSVPEVLLSGDHGMIAAWREEQRRERTEARRPDLL